MEGGDLEIIRFPEPAMILIQRDHLLDSSILENIKKNGPNNTDNHKIKDLFYFLRTYL